MRRVSSISFVGRAEAPAGSRTPRAGAADHAAAQEPQELLRADRELIRSVEELSTGRGGGHSMLLREEDRDGEWGPFQRWKWSLHFADAEGGQGGTPLLQAVLIGSVQPAALLAARYMLYRYPNLVRSAYGEGPYQGQHLLHMCIVKEEREARKKNLKPMLKTNPRPDDPVRGASQAHRAPARPLPPRSCSSLWRSLCTEASSPSTGWRRSAW